jgi:asparagine synthetase B (glutamine-hydrolysing)
MGSRARKLVLARDHMGQRAVHYFRGKDPFAFATKIKALWSSADVPQALSEAQVGRMPCLTGDVKATLQGLLPLLQRKADRSFLNEAQQRMGAWNDLLDKVSVLRARHSGPRWSSGRSAIFWPMMLSSRSTVVLILILLHAVSA